MYSVGSIILIRASVTLVVICCGAASIAAPPSRAGGEECMRRSVCHCERSATSITVAPNIGLPVEAATQPATGAPSPDLVAAPPQAADVALEFAKLKVSITRAPPWVVPTAIAVFVLGGVLLAVAFRTDGAGAGITGAALVLVAVLAAAFLFGARWARGRVVGELERRQVQAAQREIQQQLGTLVYRTERTRADAVEAVQFRSPREMSPERRPWTKTEIIYFAFSLVYVAWAGVAVLQRFSRIESRLDRVDDFIRRS